ncbi:MAG: hypothetical protein EPN82_09565 [Bacteroidetes bacterium]|nr:MAG: hypothetical protein EPN82_09565 [Bacteroidota bacterium]
MVIKNKSKENKIIKLVVVPTIMLIILAFWGCECPHCQCPDESSPVIIVPNDYKDIQEAIDSLPNEGGTVYIKAQVYNISQGIHVNKSNITIIGENGTCIKLADHVNQPVILIGSEEELPSYSNKNIRISNIEIDGNKINQDSETDPERTWIRNNGIDIRMTDNLYIDNVNIHDARSGGIVASWNCHRIIIENSYFHDNFFDGIALYSSEDICISNFFCYGNNEAGLSLDNRLKLVSFNDGLIKNNGDVGIFVRNSEDISFHGLTIKSNGSHGCFLSHKSQGTNTGVKRMFFDGCAFLDNDGWGLWLASTIDDSPKNTVSASLFSGNIIGAINGPVEESGNIFQ